MDVLTWVTKGKKTRLAKSTYNCFHRTTSLSQNRLVLQYNSEHFGMGYFHTKGFFSVGRLKILGLTIAELLFRSVDFVSFLASCLVKLPQDRSTARDLLQVCRK